MAYGRYFVNGYQGLDPWRGEEPIALTPAFVENIHKEGGSASTPRAAR